MSPAAALGVSAGLAAAWVTVLVLVGVVAHRRGRREYARRAADRRADLDRARADTDAELWADLTRLHAGQRVPLDRVAAARAVQRGKDSVVLSQLAELSPHCDHWIVTQVRPGGQMVSERCTAVPAFTRYYYCRCGAVQVDLLCAGHVTPAERAQTRTYCRSCNTVGNAVGELVTHLGTVDAPR